MIGCINAPAKHAVAAKTTILINSVVPMVRSRSCKFDGEITLEKSERTNPIPFFCTLKQSNTQCSRQHMQSRYSFFGILRSFSRRPERLSDLSESQTVPHSRPSRSRQKAQARKGPQPSDCLFHASEPAYRSTTTLLQAPTFARKISSPSTRTA